MELVSETACRQCGAPLAWRMADLPGGWIALEISPSEDGNVLLYDDDAFASVLHGELLDRARRVGTALYVRHILGASCPDF